MCISKPLPLLDQSIIDRIAKYTNRAPGQPGDCWSWMKGHDQRGGYAMVTLSTPGEKRSGRPLRVTRVVFFLHYGYDAHPLVIRHKCNTKWCVRPEHLLSGTPQQNTDDAIRDGIWRASVAPKRSPIKTTWRPTTIPIPIDHLTLECIDKFRAQIDTSGTCHNWTGLLNKGGGCLTIKGQSFLAPRIAYYLHYGIDPGSSCVLHRCDNKKCCFGLHLYLGDHKQNGQDRVERGQQATLERHGMARINRIIALDALCRHLLTGESDKRIAKSYGVDTMTINFARRGKTGWIKDLFDPESGELLHSLEEILQLRDQSLI